jgi:hypothetical protein
MNARHVSILVCISLLIAHPLVAVDSSAARQKELAVILPALQKTPPAPSNPDEPCDENPGWYDPTNRQALKTFVTKYPDTEEAYLAEVWLIFAQSPTEGSRDMSENKRLWTSRAQRLETIISKTTRPGTAKIAKIERASALHRAEDYGGFEKQMDEILGHIKEYEAEKDKQFLSFCTVTDTPLSEIEPTLRRMLIIEECHQHHLEKALALAEDLKRKFPQWSNRKGIDGNIHLLKLSKSPYPTREELNDVGRSFWK